MRTCEYCNLPENIGEHSSSCPANPENQKHLLEKFGEMALLKDVYSEEKELSQIVERPWGSYQVLGESTTFPYWKLKRIKINPNQAISLQYHHHRDETWTIIKGHGFATADGVGHSLAYSETISFLKNFFVSAGARHKITASSEGVEFFELATSLTHPISEEDIVRIEDMYGRI